MSAPRPPSTWTTQQETLLRAQGYTIGEVVADEDDFAARRAEINATTEGEALAAEVAKNGLTKAAKAKGAVNVPGHVVIQRAYTFTNYAGRFLYVEARNDLHTRHHRPGDVVHLHEPERHVVGRSTSATRAISPDGGDAAIGGNKIVRRRRRRRLRGTCTTAA